MSLQDKLDKLFEDYLKEDDLDEMSATGNVAGYQTPNAFTGDNDENEEKRKKSAVASTGYTLVGESKMKHSDIIKHTLGLAEVSYKTYKQDESMSQKKKVNTAIQEISRKLFEIERAVSQNIKLKTEVDLEGRGYWKATKQRLGKISERLVKIAGNIRELGS
tara:strand:- start:1853 stop:2338 length:486 start_codon:yes stop_codon:yes gene_type:complete